MQYLDVKVISAKNINFISVERDEFRNLVFRFHTFARKNLHLVVICVCVCASVCVSLACVP